jgi:hypothetical protein
MKKLVLLFIITLTSLSFCNAQEWFKSIDVAKRLALVQDKMLFVVWEESLDFAYPISYISNSGDLVFLDMSKDTSLDGIIWEHFIPVLLPESEYDKLVLEAEGRGARYLAKLNDDSIKIMDANKNILNVKPYSGYEQNLSELIKNYSIKTTFISQDLINYSQQENFTTSFNLASKYIDLALFVEKDIREEIIELANVYFGESKKHLLKNDVENNEAYSQRVDLMIIKEDLILNNPKKVRRLLKRMDVEEIVEVNKALFYFLNYTAYKLLNDEKEAALFQTKISEIDFKRAELIYNINN